MEFNTTVHENQQVIESYGAGRFRVSGVDYAGSVLVFPNNTVPWAVERMDGLSADSFAPIIAAEPPVEILLLGCGASLQFLTLDLRSALRNHKVGCDVMDTGAACRTYNVLIAESRRVAAALIALPA
jgi:uncharacterized protein